MTRPALLLALLALTAAAQEPIQIPSEADAKRQYYDCLIGYIHDKTDWDVTPKELLDIAVTRCERESGAVWLAILKDTPELKTMGSGALKTAKDMRNSFLETARKDAEAFIFEARHRPKTSPTP